ncbi:MAG: hypothetical protein ACYC5Y_08380 [Symbiobacteriia bacterium]
MRSRGSGHDVAREGRLLPGRGAGGGLGRFNGLRHWVASQGLLRMFPSYPEKARVVRALAGLPPALFFRKCRA